MDFSLHHFVWLSLLCCIASFAAGGTLLGFSIFNHEYEKRHISVKVIQEWVDMSEELIYFSSGIMLVALMSLYCVTKRRKRDYPYAAAVLLLQAGVVSVAVFYTYTNWDMLDSRLPLSEETIFKSTQKAIAKGARRHHNPRWVPKWLDRIQNKSKHCCGIRTFRDWNELWKPQIRGIRDHVPKSCCRHISGRGCYTDLSSIPFPETVADNIKVDSGCGYEINKYMQKIVKQSYHVLFIVTAVTTVAFLAFIAQYVFIFFLNKRPPDKKMSAIISLKKRDSAAAGLAGPSDWKSLKSLNFITPDKQGGRKHQRKHGKPSTSTITGDGSETGNNNYRQSVESIQTTDSVESNASVNTNSSGRKVYFNTDYVPLNDNMAIVPETDRGYINKNALGYVETIDQRQMEEPEYPFQYDPLNSLDYQSPDNIAQAFNTGVDYGGDEEVPSPAASPSPFASQPAASSQQQQQQTSSSGETSGEENGTRHHHHHHRIQVKGILHSSPGPGKKKHHHRKDKV